MMRKHRFKFSHSNFEIRFFEKHQCQMLLMNQGQPYCISQRKALKSATVKKSLPSVTTVTSANNSNKWNASVEKLKMPTLPSPRSTRQTIEISRPPATLSRSWKMPLKRPPAQRMPTMNQKTSHML